MAQLVARLVRNEKVGGSNPPSSTTWVGLIARPFVYLLFFGLKDEKSWSEPDLSALWCGKVWFKVVGGQL